MSEIPVSLCSWNQQNPPPLQAKEYPFASIRLPFPLPAPLFLFSSTTPSHRKPGLPENKQGERGRDTGWGGGLGAGGCFCPFPAASLGAAGLTALHPEETSLTSLRPALTHKLEATDSLVHMGDIKTQLTTQHFQNVLAMRGWMNKH